jgi:uncharacterized protein (TIGR00369 family)
MSRIEAEGLAPVAPEVLATLSGLELFRAMLAGDAPSPPVAALTQQRLLEVEAGRVVWEARPPANFLNPAGGVHGGWAMTVLDSALGCAVHSALPAGRGYTTVEVKANLTRAPEIGECYRCEGRLITLGRRTGTAEARLTDSAGRVAAFGTTTCLVFDL